MWWTVCLTFIMGILVRGGRDSLVGLARTHVQTEGLWTDANFKSTGAGLEVGPLWFGGGHHEGMQGESDGLHGAHTWSCHLHLLWGCDAPLYCVAGWHHQVSGVIAEGHVGAVCSGAGGQQADAVRWVERRALWVVVGEMELMSSFTVTTILVLK